MFDLVTTPGVNEFTIGLLCLISAFGIYRENRRRRVRPVAQLIRADEPPSSRFLSVLSIATAVIGSMIFAAGVIKLAVL